MNAKLRDLVRRRAQFRCEYCGLPEVNAPVTPLRVEHIIARKHDGVTQAANLCLACHHCNLHKGSDLVGLDRDTKRRIPLLNPRRHKWNEHFAWDEVVLVGTTAIGRTTVKVLAMNDADMIDLRQRLQEEGAFPW